MKSRTIIVKKAGLLKAFANFREADPETAGLLDDYVITAFRITERKGRTTIVVRGTHPVNKSRRSIKVSCG